MIVSIPFSFRLSVGWVFTIVEFSEGDAVPFKNGLFSLNEMLTLVRVSVW